MAAVPMMPEAHAILKGYFPGVPWIVNRATLLGPYHVITTDLGRSKFNPNISLTLVGQAGYGAQLKRWDDLGTEELFRAAVQDLQEYLNGLVAALDRAMGANPTVPVPARVPDPSPMTRGTP